MIRQTMVILMMVAVPGASIADGSTAPEWYLEEVATLTNGSGRWVADNSAYKSDDEPFEAYVTEWIAGFGGTTLTGRLFGLQEGTETVSFWEFRQYWHPGKQAVIIEQFGWGNVVGIGISWHDGNKTHSEQNFHGADGSSSRSGHISEFPDAGTHITESFDIQDDKWIPQRSYTWRRSDVKS